MAPHAGNRGNRGGRGGWRGHGGWGSRRGWGYGGYGYGGYGYGPGLYGLVDAAVPVCTTDLYTGAEVCTTGLSSFAGPALPLAYTRRGLYY